MKENRFVKAFVFLGVLVSVFSCLGTFLLVPSPMPIEQKILVILLLGIIVTVGIWVQRKNF